MRPHRWQPTRLPCPWDSPGKNTGVGCHFLLQCMKVKSESEVAQSCPTLSNPTDCSPPGSCIHGILQARVLEWVAVAFSPIYGSSHIISALDPLVGCHSNWSLSCGQGAKKKSSFLGIFHIKIESICFFLRVYILRGKVPRSCRQHVSWHVGKNGLQGECSLHEYKGFLDQWRKSIWCYNDGYMSLYICLNPWKIHH